MATVLPSDTLTKWFYDGNEVGASSTRHFFYGPGANRLAETVVPLLRDQPPQHVLVIDKVRAKIRHDSFSDIFTPSL